MTQLGLKSINGAELENEWISRAKTYLGIMISGYPNMFHIYGPHGQTLLSNGLHISCGTGPMNHRHYFQDRGQ